MMDKIIKKFNTPEEEREFWSKHDPLDFVDDDAAVVFAPTAELAEKHRLKSMTIRLDESQIADAKRIASLLKMPYQTFLRGLITQALALENRRIAQMLTPQTGKIRVHHPSLRISNPAASDTAAAKKQRGK